MQTKRRLSSAIICAVMLIALVMVPLFAISASAADGNTVQFTFGANGSTSHADGSTKTSYAETVNGYTITLTATAQFYTGARDAKGNSCIKLGSSKNAGGFKFTVPADVESVIIYVAGYKSSTAKVTVNGTTHTVSELSNNGAYKAITVDTSATKDISFTTVSGGLRCMVNGIDFIVAAAGSCTHEDAVYEVTKAPTCTEAGEETAVCECGETLTKPIAATGHDYEIDEYVEPTCNAIGSKTEICANCGDEVYTEYAPAHKYENGVCTECGVVKLDATITFDDVAKRTEKTTTVQVWVENGITVTNDKDKSTTTIGDYSAPARFYKGSLLTIKADFGNITEIVLDSATGEYLGNLKSSLTAAGINFTENEDKVTVALDGSSDTFSFSLTGGQVRLDGVTVACTPPAPVEPEAPEYTEPTILGANVNVGTDLAIKYHVYIPDEYLASDIILKVTNPAHNTYAELEAVVDGNTYVFVYDNIAPQCMSDKLDAELIIDGEVAATKIGYSIVDNAKNLAAEEDATAELKQFLADLLAYGQAAQKYLGATVAITDADIAAIGAAGTKAPDASITETDRIINQPADFDRAYISGAGVVFDNEIQIFVNVKGADAANAKVLVNGEYYDVVDGVVCLPGMSITEISAPVVIDLQLDGATVHSITYGVYAYVYQMMAKEPGSAMANLAQALYNCAESAKDYN